MDVSLKPGKENTTWVSYNRKYTDEELKWLKKHIETLEQYNMDDKVPTIYYDITVVNLLNEDGTSTTHLSADESNLAKWHTITMLLSGFVAFILVLAMHARNSLLFISKISAKEILQKQQPASQRVRRKKSL